MLELLKRGREEPVLEKIMTNEGDSYLNGKKDEVKRVDLLLQLPGIGLHNVYGILRRIQKVMIFVSGQRTAGGSDDSTGSLKSFYFFAYSFSSWIKDLVFV